MVQRCFLKSVDFMAVCLGCLRSVGVFSISLSRNYNFVSSSGSWSPAYRHLSCSSDMSPPGLPHSEEFLLGIPASAAIYRCSASTLQPACKIFRGPAPQIAGKHGFVSHKPTNITKGFILGAMSCRGNQCMVVGLGIPVIQQGLLS